MKNYVKILICSLLIVSILLIGCSCKKDPQEIATDDQQNSTEQEAGYPSQEEQEAKAKQLPAQRTRANRMDTTLLMIRSPYG